MPTTTVVDLNGAWASGGVTGPFISVTGNAISVDMSAYSRPFAAGSVIDSSHITVTFADDNTYTAELIPGEGGAATIQWSNGSAWTKVPLLTTTLLNLDGKWVSAGTSKPVFAVSVNDRSITLDMSAAGRPPARGIVLDFADIYVYFPDDTGYTGKLEISTTSVSGGVATVNTIRWSNNSEWQQIYAPSPTITMSWQLQGTIKTLFVSGIGFSPGLVTIKVTSNNFQIAEFTGFAAGNGTFTASQAISCTGNAFLHISVYQTSANPVVTSGAVCPQPPPS
jgi:hypothetical protein